LYCIDTCCSQRPWNPLCRHPAKVLTLTLPVKQKFCKLWPGVESYEWLCTGCSPLVPLAGGRLWRRFYQRTWSSNSAEWNGMCGSVLPNGQMDHVITNTFLCTPSCRTARCTGQLCYRAAWQHEKHDFNPHSCVHWWHSCHFDYPWSMLTYINQHFTLKPGSIWKPTQGTSGKLYFFGRTVRCSDVFWYNFPGDCTDSTPPFFAHFLSRFS
jgi:hypothetical protein